MSAYILFDNLTVTSPEDLETYKSQVAEVVEKHPGKYVVLGGKTRVVEGSVTPSYLVMIQFPSFEMAENWYDSDEYKDLKALRMSATTSTGVIIEGLPA
ncbi:Uncharacterized conserved protein, DUF1330 family [Ekhidna lutea]|uniref:Uncharacterized conserved protein, DUF1330 family n=1 Tax=Ekhidna lutea TaxID=447679 RepID=A0A239LCA0_EKHLU|nr:DUF1330 domain-containing protein [Ekhidna lutea]SNT27935.1 Uncharacterized conserved protein, DUF1330 family [Ekhidna lutea]